MKSTIIACVLFGTYLASCSESAPGPFLIDATQSSGIDFSHTHGGIGNRELPETMGGGIALLDFDHDGDVDAYFAQSGQMRSSDPRAKRKPGRNLLFANDGSGHFARVKAFGAGDGGYGQGVTCGDFDGDGWDDLLSLNWGANRLYRNESGKFKDVTAVAELEPFDEWSISAAFFDAEGDGDLDLYIVNYLVAQPGSHLVMGDPDGFKGYPHPDRFPGQADRFYVNDDGKLRDQTAAAGLLRPSGKGLGIAPTDIDLDGLVDLYVANDSTPNFLFHNLGELNFEEIALKAGVAYNEDGQSEAGMGIDTGDMDGDGDFDLFVTNLDGETNTLYRNEWRADNERVRFTDVTRRSGLGKLSENLVGFGTLFADVSLDGNLDLIVVNGHVLDNAHVLSDIRTYAQPNQLFMGDGKGRFAVPTADRAVPALDIPSVSRGVASADFNSDGALDFMIATNNGPTQLFMGTPSASASLALTLNGPAGNRHGLGASVILTLVDDSQILLRAESARSYASASYPVLVTGLPAAVREVTVIWPGGKRETWTNFDEPFEGARTLGD
ncbi:MAG: hypothetical protein ACI8TQ_003183 [Planctomycetota bacterium]|jgi:hypothetical protein